MVYCLLCYACARKSCAVSYVFERNARVAQNAVPGSFISAFPDNVRSVIRIILRPFILVQRLYLQ